MKLIPYFYRTVKDHSFARGAGPAFGASKLALAASRRPVFHPVNLLIHVPGRRVTTIEGYPLWRGLLYALPIALCATGIAKAACPGHDKHIPTEVVGAIRWDAWYDDSDGAVQQAVREALSPPIFRSRLPWFATQSPLGSPRIEGNNQAVIDKEIELASAHGIGYWAFLYYPDNAMEAAFKMYLKSANKRLLGFTLIDGAGWGATTETFRHHIAERVALMTDPQWQKVLDGRPIYFLAIPPSSMFNDWINKFWGGDLTKMRTALEWLRLQSQVRGAGLPYVVGVGTALP